MWFWIIVFCIFFGAINIAYYKRWDLFLLIVCGIFFLPSLILTIVLLCSSSSLYIATGVVALLFGGFGLGALFRSRCPKCKKFFVVKQVGKKLVQMGEIYHNDSGDKRYQDNLYEIELNCKQCNYEWTKNKTEKKEVY